VSLRILFAIHTDPDPFTAVFMNASRRAAHLREMGHAVDVITPDARPWSWPRLRPVLLPIATLFRAPWRYDVVVFHSYAGWAFHVCRACLPRGRRTVTITAFHGLEPLYHGAVSEELARSGERLSARFRFLHQRVVPMLLRMSCRRSTGVFCLNRGEADFLVREGWCEPSRIAIVANGVDAELLVRREHRGAARRLLFVGQWLRAKGTRTLTRAFASVATTHPEVTLVCAGTGASAAAVLSDFDPSLRPRVTVLPRVTRAELARELTAADVFLFPTVSEGFSGALLEALASSLAVVTTRVGAAGDLLQHERDVLFVPVADADALAAAARRLIEDDRLRQAIADGAHHVARAHQWQAVNAAYCTELLRAACPRDNTVLSPGSNAVVP
jgi:glycosyltransferase involved in cell wall biosynthesis